MKRTEFHGRDATREDSEPVAKVTAKLDADLSGLPDFALLRDYWEGKRRGRALPRFADIDPLELKEHLGRLFVARLLEDGSDFRYTLFGTELTLIHGTDYTGRTVTETFAEYAPGFGPSVIEAYKACLETGRPLLSHGQVVWADKDHLDFRSIHLACSSDGTRRDIVFGKLVFARPDGRGTL